MAATIPLYVSGALLRYGVPYMRQIGLLSRSAHPALGLALLAMWLVVAGPLIGQISAADHYTGHRDSPHAHHHGAAKPHATKPTHAATEQAGSPGLHEACGYCSLYQHVPVLFSALPRAVAPRHHVRKAASETPASGYRLPAVFSHAPCRAPPVPA